MSELDRKLQEYRSQVGQYLDRKRMYENQASEALNNAKLIEARISGILEAKALFEIGDEQETPNLATAVEHFARKRTRSLTGHWQDIMQLVNEIGDFSYDDLADAAEAVGHEVGRDSLRSQMSGYKTGGLVQSVGDGVFRMTDYGRKAAGIATNSGEKSPNENGAAEAAPEAETDANPFLPINPRNPILD